MKYLHYFALVATATAVRLTDDEETAFFSDDVPDMVQLSTEKHIPSPEEMWKYYDKDGNGQWDIKEAMSAFKGIMNSLGHKLPTGWKKIAKKEFKEMDADGSGAVSSNEMIMYIAGKIDTNNDGAWDIKEVYNAIRHLAKFTKNNLIKGWKKLVKEVFDTVDANGDGSVDPKELFAAIKKGGFPDFNGLFEQQDKKVELESLIEVEAEAEEEAEKKIPSPEEMWKYYDKDGSGEWDIKEAMSAFRGMMKYFKHKLPKGWKKIAMKEFKEMDTDGSGGVSPNEMIMYIAGKIDTNNDNAWQLEEVYNALEKLAGFTRNTLVQGWKEIVKDLFNEVDTNGDGSVQACELFAEFKNNGYPDMNGMFEQKEENKIHIEQLTDISEIFE